MESRKQYNLTNLIQHLLIKAESEKIKRFVVGAIIQKNNQVLCLKRAAHDFLPGLYELPSGRVEEGENLFDALKRETLEETSLSIIDVVDYFNYFDYYSGSGVLTRQFNFVVECDMKQAVILDPKEHEGYAWLSNHDLSHYHLSSEINQTIAAYYQHAAANLNNAELIENAREAGVSRFVVGGLIARDNKILVLNRSSNDFLGGLDELPSGRVDKGESLIMALRREVKEETGLSIQSIEQYLGHFDYQSKSGALTRQFNFAITTDPKEKVILSEEHQGLLWMPENMLSRINVSKEVKEIIENHFSLLKLNKVEPAKETGFEKLSVFAATKRKHSEPSKTPDSEAIKPKSTKIPRYEEDQQAKDQVTGRMKSGL